jgi:hypothetical protein
MAQLPVRAEIGTGLGDGTVLEDEPRKTPRKSALRFRASGEDLV